MAAAIEPPDAMDVLARMRPSLDEVGHDWSPEERRAVLDRVLAQPGGRSRWARWIAEGAAVAAAGRVSYS